MYYRARYYDPSLGQFVSPDTIVPEPSNVLDYNRYLYGLGNPVRYNDPTGHCSLCLVAVLAGVAMLVPSDTPLSPEEAEAYAPTGMAGAVLLTGGTAAYFAPAVLSAGANAVCGDGDCTNEVSSVTKTANAACADGDCTNEVQTLDNVRRLGRAGEAASGIVRNTNRIPSASRTAAYRIPDGLSATTLSEVKNVARLSYTNQLRDFAAYAQSQSLTFELHVRRTTVLSEPLRNAVSNGEIILRFLPVSTPR